jgi:hypothetical protein
MNTAYFGTERPAHIDRNIQRNSSLDELEPKKSGDSYDISLIAEDSPPEENAGCFCYNFDHPGIEKLFENKDELRGAVNTRRQREVSYEEIALDGSEEKLWIIMGWGGWSTGMWDGKSIKYDIKNTSLSLEEAIIVQGDLGKARAKAKDEIVACYDKDIRDHFNLSDGKDIRRFIIFE